MTRFEKDVIEIEEGNEIVPPIQTKGESVLSKQICTDWFSFLLEAKRIHKINCRIGERLLYWEKEK